MKRDKQTEAPNLPDSIHLVPHPNSNQAVLWWAATTVLLLLMGLSTFRAWMRFGELNKHAHRLDQKIRELQKQRPLRYCQRLEAHLKETKQWRNQDLTELNTTYQKLTLKLQALEPRVKEHKCFLQKSSRPLRYARQLQKHLEVVPAQRTVRPHKGTQLRLCRKGSKPRPCYTGPAGTRGGRKPCKTGKRRCIDGLWSQCLEEIVPTPEICDGKDNDCDGKTDEGQACLECKFGSSRSCYSGPKGTRGVGQCRGGKQKCEAGKWGPCLCEVLPQKEVCDQHDNNCNGKIDELPTCQKIKVKTRGRVQRQPQSTNGTQPSDSEARESQ